jgi:hypothetical protein
MRSKILLTGKLVMLILVVGASCKYQDDPMEQIDICDLSNVTYVNIIKPIIDNNCLVCHSVADAAGGLEFETFNGLKQVASNGKLVGSIKHSPGFIPMPEFAPKLHSCDIEKIEKWIQDGAENN